MHDVHHVCGYAWSAQRLENNSVAFLPSRSHGSWRLSPGNQASAAGTFTHGVSHRAKKLRDPVSK